MKYITNLDQLPEGAVFTGKNSVLVTTRLNIEAMSDEELKAVLNRSAEDVLKSEHEKCQPHAPYTQVVTETAQPYGVISVDQAVAIRNGNDLVGLGSLEFLKGVFPNGYE